MMNRIKLLFFLSAVFCSLLSTGQLPNGIEHMQDLQADTISMNSKSCQFSHQTMFTSSFNLCNHNPWTLVFEDEFEGNELDRSIWILRPEGYGKLYGQVGPYGIEQEYNTYENAVVSDGMLKIVSKREERVEIAIDYYPEDMVLPDGLPNLRPYHYTSSNLWTIPNFPYGIIEAKIKIPKGKGLWPAFWLFAGDGSTGVDGLGYEIDIFEFWNEKTSGSFDPDKLSKTHHMNIHHWIDDHSDNCGKDYNGTDFSEDFHVFTLQWERDKVQWFVDGELKRTENYVWTLLGQDAGCYIEAYSRYLVNELFSNYPMSIILNTAIQTGDNNDPDETTPFPNQMEIQWLRYYQRNPYSDVFVTDQTLFPVDEKIYNTIVGRNVNVNCIYDIPADRYLAIKAEKAVSILPGFHAEEGSYLHIKADNNLYEEEKAGKGSKSLTDRMGSQDYVGQAPFTYTIEEEDGIAIYPNPNDGCFWLCMGELKGDCNYVVFDMFGQSICEGNTQNRSAVSIDLSGFAPGMYVIRVFNKVKDLSFSQKIIMK